MIFPTIYNFGLYLVFMIIAVFFAVSCIYVVSSHLIERYFEDVRFDKEYN